MNEHIFKTVEIIGTSPDSIEDAVRNAISRAGKSIHGLKWFEVIQIRGALEESHVAQWQVTAKINFEIDEG